MTKKKVGQLRFCFIVRYLNAVTTKDAYPLLRIADSLSKLEDAKCFINLDLISAFCQEIMRGENRFVCQLGSYQSKRKLLGQCNGSATFQVLMDQT